MMAMSVILILILAALAPLPGQTQSPAKESVTRFAQVVQDHFAAWDLNHDGRLESQEIDQLMNRHGIRGEAAAALAAIKRCERAAPIAERTHFSIEVGQLTGASGLEPSAAGDPAHGSRRPFNFEAQFRRHVKVLRTLVPRLFAGTRPDFHAMRQGPIGDCYFFSLTGYLAARRPQKIVRMIEPEPHGTFRVRFLDGEVIAVSAPTQAEMLVNNSPGSLADGYWLCVLEKAVGKRMRATTKSQARRTAEATDAMAAGGDTTLIIKLYSGHKARAVKLRDPKEAARRMAELRLTIPSALSRAMLASVEMGREPPQGHARVPGLGYGHAYAILGYSAKTDQVKIWNPWGQDFIPMGPQGIEHGFATKHGVFLIPLATLYDQFSTVHLETTTPAVKEAHGARTSFEGPRRDTNVHTVVGVTKRL